MNMTIMANCRSNIHNHMPANRNIGREAGIGTNNGPLPDGNAMSDPGTWMHKLEEIHIAALLDACHNLVPCRCITNADDDMQIGVAVLFQPIYAAQHRKTMDIAAMICTIFIHESKEVELWCKCIDILDDLVRFACHAANSKNHQVPEYYDLSLALPRNRGIVSMPWALIPSLTNTFFTVRNSIFISNRND